MKTLSLCAVLLFSIFNTQFSFAQTTAATIKVLGNCESCKNRIEKAAKNAGATTAAWNEDSKALAVSFDTSKTSTAKIEQAIAAKGHDTEHFSSDAAAYNKLPGCCQYERATAAADVKDAKCCSHENCKATGAEECKKMDCCKDKACCSKTDAKKCNHDKENCKKIKA
ncbi:MAG: cation transporter [Bacteroidota bacterium]